MISRLKDLTEKGLVNDEVEKLEDIIAEEIEKHVKEESFYKLPTNEISKIIKKSEIGDDVLLCDVISKMNKNKGEESTLLLNVIKIEEAPLEECIKIISKFEYSPVCQRTSQLFNEYKESPVRDYEYENEELWREVDILKAAEEGNLTMVQRLFQRGYPNPKDLSAAINNASWNGHLEIVKYLYETCHAEVPVSAITNASFNGHLEVIKYLYETCHANVETKDDYGWTPINYASYNGHLEVIKYLHETCHADVETKHKYGHTPIIIASYKGHNDVVEYLHETCHANVTEVNGYDTTIDMAFVFKMLTGCLKN